MVKPLCFTCGKKPGKPYFCSQRCAAKMGEAAVRVLSGPWCGTCRKWLTYGHEREEHELQGHALWKPD